MQTHGAFMGSLLSLTTLTCADFVSTLHMKRKLRKKTQLSHSTMTRIHKEYRPVFSDNFKSIICHKSSAGFPSGAIRPSEWYRRVPQCCCSATNFMENNKSFGVMLLLCFHYIEEFHRVVVWIVLVPMDSCAWMLGHREEHIWRHDLVEGSVPVWRLVLKWYTLKLHPEWNIVSFCYLQIKM